MEKMATADEVHEPASKEREPEPNPDKTYLPPTEPAVPSYPVNQVVIHRVVEQRARRR